MVYNSQHGPAQRQLVHQLIDWKRVEDRCKRYPALGRAFPVPILKSRSKSPPYYCHYMAWRLGTFNDESLVKHWEELFRCAESLPEWKQEQSLLHSAEFSDFWSLVWQLQVAEYLCKIGKDVRWAKSGPDLSVEIGGERWFVECYTYRKSFGVQLFLEELLLRIDENIRVYYDKCLPFRLPQNSDRTQFLDEILRPFLDPAYLANHKADAEREYPVVLYKDLNSSLYIYVERRNSTYNPCIIPRKTGDPEQYLEVALREAVEAKSGSSNDLPNHHPNLVAVNYLLSTGYQMATSLRPGSLGATAGNNSHIDALAVSAVGIDEQLTREKLRVIFRSDDVAQENLNQIVNG